MPTPSPRVAAVPRLRAASAVLALLLLLVADALALGADGGQVAATATDRSWAPGTAGSVWSDVTSSALRSRLRAMPPSTQVGIHPATGLVRSLAGTRRRPLAPAPARTDLGTGSALRPTPDATARAFLRTAGPLFGIRSVGDLRTDRVDRRPDGRSVVRYQQHLRGIPVIGGELIVRLDARGAVLGVNGEATPPATSDALTMRPTLPLARAQAVAATWVAREAGGDAAQVVTRSEGLAIHDPRLLGSGGPPRPRLVWRIDARIDAPAPGTDLPAVHHVVLVDALDGTIAGTQSRIAAGLVRRICDFRNVRTKEFRCTTRKITRAEGDPPSGRQQVDAMYRLMAQLQAFYRGRFGHDGVNGKGSRYTATVRFCLPTWCPMNNAFWEWGPQQATFGDGWADTDDFVGHEFTHGVLDSHARLFYDHQSGALNESLADIFGEGFDLSNDWGSDGSRVRWLLGEDLRGGAVRDMQEPGRFGDPDRMRSPRWEGGPGDSGGVHSNSGVGNRTASLIADGGTFNGRSVRGIGLMPMLHLFYEAMANRLTSASDYLDLYDALRFGCVDLAGSRGITLADCKEVQDAVEATELDRLPVTGAPREAPVCATGRYPINAFLDDLERPAESDWSSSALRGGRDPWFYPPNPNPRPDWDGTWASSGRFNLVALDLARVTDAAMTLTRPVEVPAGGFLRFEHGYRFDSGSRYHDGGVVEISVAGGRWVDLGRRFTNSGYTGVLVRGGGNPLGGRRAFVGVSRGWGASRADLSPYAGKRVRIRFRIATDRSGGAPGWYIDDIRIHRCARDRRPPTGTLVIGDGGGTVSRRKPPLTITADDAGRSGVHRMRLSNRGLMADGLLKNALEMPYRETVEGWSLTDPAFGGTDGDGQKTVHVQLRDRAGNWSEPFRAQVQLDLP